MLSMNTTEQTATSLTLTTEVRTDYHGSGVDTAVTATAVRGLRFVSADGDELAASDLVDLSEQIEWSGVDGVDIAAESDVIHLSIDNDGGVSLYKDGVEVRVAEPCWIILTSGMRTVYGPGRAVLNENPVETDPDGEWRWSSWDEQPPSVALREALGL